MLPYTAHRGTERRENIKCWVNFYARMTWSMGEQTKWTSVQDKYCDLFFYPGFPYYTLYSRNPRLPLDVMFPLPHTSVKYTYTRTTP